MESPPPEGTSASLQSAEPDPRVHVASVQCGADCPLHRPFNRHYAGWLAEQNAVFDTQGIWNDDLRVW